MVVWLPGWWLYFYLYWNLEERTRVLAIKLLILNSVTNINYHQTIWYASSDISSTLHTKWYLLIKPFKCKYSLKKKKNKTRWNSICYFKYDMF